MKLNPEKKPVLPLPGWLAPWVAFFTILAGAALMELDAASPWAKACRIMLAVGAAYGAVSPGWWGR
jgi:hypothetical protein